LCAERKGEGPTPPPLYMLATELYTVYIIIHVKRILLLLLFNAGSSCSKRCARIIIIMCIYNIYGTRKLAWCEHFLKDTREMVEWRGGVREGGRKMANGCDETARNSSGKTSAFPYFLLVDVKELRPARKRGGGRGERLCVWLITVRWTNSLVNADFHRIRSVYAEYCKRKSYTYT